MGRLKPGATIEAAQAEIASICNALSPQYPATNVGHAAKVVRMKDDMVKYIRPTLLLLCSVGFVLIQSPAPTYFNLALREGIIGDMIRNAPSASVHGAYGVQPFCANHVLEQIAEGAGLDCAKSLHVPAVRGELHDAGIGELAADRCDGVGKRFSKGGGCARRDAEGPRIPRSAEGS